jgi:hypothetical protein
MFVCQVRETVRNGVSRIPVDDRKNFLRSVCHVTFLVDLGVTEVSQTDSTL